MEEEEEPHPSQPLLPNGEEHSKRKLIISHLKDSLLSHLSESNPSLKTSNASSSIIHRRLHHLFTSFNTPTHPPYALMIHRAITKLNEENGSTEEAISDFIRKEYDDLPWCHERILGIQLDKLCQDKELVCNEGGRYVLVADGGDRVGSGGKEEAEECKRSRKKRKRDKKRNVHTSAVRKEIADETDRITGKTKQISNIPIHLSIYSPNVVNLTLIDLPGLTKVAVEGQQESIVQDIENMVRSYVEKPNCIILAISPANQDIATSDAIKIAREVDPSGERTFGVVTKLDLMDKGTNAVEVLEGRQYRLQHPWVGIVNRSQADINRNVDMIVARKKEREYFETSPEYGHLAHKMGSEYLAKLLSQHLEQVIRQKIPSIIALINKTIDELNAELDRIGRPIAVDSGAQLYTILEMCRAFDKVFKEHLDGGRPGGDRIYGVFDNQLPAALKKLPFERHLGMKNVQRVVTEADGYQPHLIAPEQGYRRLIEGSIGYFKGPAEASVDAVHFVLKELVRKSIAETEELKRFPTLSNDIATAANEALERFREESRKTTLRLVDMESSYLTVEFFRKINLEPERNPNGPNPNRNDKNDKNPPPTPNMDNYSDNHLRKIGSNVNAYINMVCDTLKNSIPKAVVYCQVREAKRSLLNHFYVQVGKKEKEKLGAMLDEDPALMEKRNQIAKRLELYKQARDDIDSVAWK